MMQTTEPEHGYDSAACFEIFLSFTVGRHSFRQRKMCPVNACFHPGQSRLNITQNNLSGAANHDCRCFCFKNSKLLAKSQVFQKQVVAGMDRPNEQDEQELQCAEHGPVVEKSTSDVVSSRRGQDSRQ
jgi:hypothetical protein